MDDALLLERMLRIRSHSREEGPLAQFLVEWMRARGFDAQIDAVGNAVGRRGDPTSGPTILLLGHMDTVHGEVPVRREGSLLFGRGAVDAKGPLAAFLVAASRFTGPGCVMVVGAVEEEAATSRGARHIVEGPEPDCAVIGEPSSWDRVTVGYKGRLLAQYSVVRTMAHTAGARASACETAFDFWRAVRSETDAFNADRPGGQFDRLQASLRTMHSASDGLTERAALDLGFRLPVGFDVHSWQRSIEALGGDGDVTFHAHEEAVRVDKNTPLARAMLAAIREEQGEPRFAVKTGTSDLNVIAARWRCPMLAYGPGDAALDHTPNEHIDLADYERAIAVLTRALQALSCTLQRSSVPA